MTFNWFFKDNLEYVFVIISCTNTQVVFYNVGEYPTVVAFIVYYQLILRVSFKSLKVYSINN